MFCVVLCFTSSPRLRFCPFDIVSDTLSHKLGLEAVQEVMRDPVMLEDGFTYERVQITAWLQGHDSSPMTGQPLQGRKLVSNGALRSVITAISLRPENGL